MKWVTREKAKVDRIACPWLIKKFVDPEAEFLFVPPDQVLKVAGEQNAIPFDVPNVELGHHEDKCSFDAIIEKYKLNDKALWELAQIVRGADTLNQTLTPESAGLAAIAEGFRGISKDDYDNMKKQFYVYDALYEFCKMRVGE
ncbi:MAG: chromate resistance protein [candidate division Zixibacteria bacterium RBG_16_40_9]|nr:MAG: chromate resistance protein [candidate division Zixibacteria bacterium RBG_16_40_9]